jgi:phenylacetate-CoA ligase
MGVLLDRAFGTAFVLARSPGQRSVPYLDPKELANRRDARVRELVRFAAHSVPHYRDLFRRDGIDPETIRGADDLTRLPFLDKSEIRRAPERFISDSRRGRDAVVFETSGTTGLRLRIAHDRNDMLNNIAVSERERAILTAATGRSVGYRELVLGYAGNTRSKVLAFNRAHTFLPIRPGRRMVSLDQSFSSVVGEINDYRPDVLIGYGSYLEAFFRRAIASGTPVHRPRVIVFGGEAMSPEGQAFVEREIGTPIVSRYNAVEAFQIGFTCEARNGYHLHEDLCHLQILDEQGGEAPVGEPGEIVISNLVNHGTVLLNYRIGDIGRLSNDACTCGRTFRLLQDFHGRVEDVVYLSDDRFVHPRVIWGVLKTTPEILRYQLIQRERTRFELRIMTVDEAAFDIVTKQVLAPMRKLLAPAQVEASRAEELGFGKAGKFRPVIAMERPR